VQPVTILVEQLVDDACLSGTDLGVCGAHSVQRVKDSLEVCSWMIGYLSTEIRSYPEWLSNIVCTVYKAET
jgi:hypothetical protein